MQALTTEDAGQAPRRFPALEDYPPLAAAACVVGAVAFALFGRPFMSSFLALVLLALCIYPAARYASDRRHDVPAIPILAGAYAVQFAVPVFFSGGALWLVDGLYTLDPASINVALAIAIVAFVGFTGPA